MIVITGVEFNRKSATQGAASRYTFQKCLYFFNFFLLWRSPQFSAHWQ